MGSTCSSAWEASCIAGPDMYDMLEDEDNPTVALRLHLHADRAIKSNHHAKM